MLRQLWRDECGAIISAELVLVATILVIGMVVGLSELQHAVVQELNDVADAIGNVNQTYMYTGFRAVKSFSAVGDKSLTAGSSFRDEKDDCDNNQCSIACLAPETEAAKQN
jgi:Flp pilus assembly pilin Flp